MRVLVTGSKAWNDPEKIWLDLEELRDALAPGEILTVVDGKCPTGADFFAGAWASNEQAEGRSIKSERHPADWNGPCDADCKPNCRKRRGICERAGFRRNKLMVDLGADLVLAYIRNDSNGTMNTVGHAEKAGIPVRKKTVID